MQANIIKFDKIEDKIIELRGEKVIIDSDVADLYGVKTKEINQAVSNNAEKFPNSYIFELTKAEREDVVKNFDHLKKLKFSPHLPKAFTERGLYMLATILKGERATQTTLAIVDTFYRIKTLSRTIKELSTITQISKKRMLGYEAIRSEINVMWHHATIKRVNIEKLNEHKSVALWFSGLSGAVKSTLAHTIEEKLYHMGFCRKKHHACEGV